MQSLLMLCLFCLLYWCAAVTKPIPALLKKRLREVHTFNDLTSLTNVMYQAKKYDSQPELGYSRQQSRLKVQGASVLDLRANSNAQNLRVIVDEDMRTNMQILSTIRQGNDSCELQSVCVPVPEDNPDPGILIFPRCYQVTQCIGSCCDATERCHPISIEYLQQPIVEMLYIGNNQFAINQTLNITIEQHIACSCRDCGLTSQCHRGTSKTGSGCNCVCDRDKGIQNCSGWNRAWNEEKCKCECAIKHCFGSAQLDEEQCVCKLQYSPNANPLLAVDADQPDQHGNFRVNASHLRKLRLQSRRN